MKYYNCVDQAKNRMDIIYKGLFPSKIYFLFRVDSI